MNKMIKGSIAGATGIAVLMGGFGTYALWSDDATLPGNSVTSGVLDVDAGVASFTDGTEDADGTPITQANGWSHLIVPGDTVTRTQSFDFTATGKNLFGTIVFDPGAETDGATDFNAFGDALDIEIAVDGDDVTPGGDDWCFEWEAPGFGTKTVNTSVDFIFNDVNEQVAQNARTALAASTITITQGESCPVVIP